MLFAGWEVGIKDPKRLTITANSFAKMDQHDDSARRERAGRMGNSVRYRNQWDCRICQIPPAHKLKKRKWHYYIAVYFYD